jgi:hypothetical protein
MTISPLETKLLTLGFERLDGAFWSDDSGLTVLLSVNDFRIECIDPCANTLPMLAKVVDAMQELRECKDCGHLMRDKALDDFDRTRFDADTWNVCSVCLAADSLDGIVAERDFYAAIGRGGRG